MIPLFLVSLEKHVMAAPVISFTAFHLGYKALSVNIQETENVYKLSSVPIVAHSYRVS